MKASELKLWDYYYIDHVASYPKRELSRAKLVSLSPTYAIFHVPIWGNYGEKVADGEVTIAIGEAPKPLMVVLYRFLMSAQCWNCVVWSALALVMVLEISGIDTSALVRERIVSWLLTWKG